MEGPAGLTKVSRDAGEEVGDGDKHSVVVEDVATCLFVWIGLEDGTDKNKLFVENR